MSNTTIMNVASGKSHIGLITKEGEIFMGGNNDYGQLGDGQNHTKQRSFLVKIESLINKGLLIDQVSCGFSHTLAVTSTGRIFSWGNGTQGQLGLGNNESLSSPAEVEYFRSKYQTANEILSLQCGANHSGLLDQRGNLFMWGAGEVGQLGTGNRMDELHPMIIKPHLHQGEQVINISLGYFHTLILTSSKRCQQSGLPSDSPATIFSSIPCIDGYEVSKIKAAHISYVLNTQGHLMHFQTPYSVTKLDNIIVEDFEIGQDQSILRAKDNAFYFYYPETKKLKHLTEINGKSVSSLTILSCGPSYILGIKNRSTTQNKERHHKSQHQPQQQLIRHHRHSSSMDKIGNYQARYDKKRLEEQIKEQEQREGSEKSRGQSTQVRKMSESNSQHTMMPKSNINSNNKHIPQTKNNNLYPISDEKLLKRRRKIEFEDSSHHYGSPDRGFQQRSQIIEYQNSIMHQDSLRQIQPDDQNLAENKTDKRKLKEALKQEIHLRLGLEKQLVQLQREFDLFRDEVGVDQMRKLLNDSQTEYQKLYEVCVKECEKATKYLELYKKEKHMREERESQIMELGLSEEMLRNQIKHVDSQLSQMREQHQQEQQSLQLTIVELQKALDSKEEDKQRLKEKLFDIEESNQLIRTEVKQVEDHYKGLIMIEKQNQQILSSQVTDLKSQVSEYQDQNIQLQKTIKQMQTELGNNKRQEEETTKEIQNLKQMIQVKCQNLREYDQTFVGLRQNEKEQLKMIESLKEQIRQLTQQQLVQAPEMISIPVNQQPLVQNQSNQKQVINRSNSSASVSVKKQTINTTRTDISSMKSNQKTNSKSPNFQTKKVQPKNQAVQISQRQQIQKMSSEHSPEKLSKILQQQENQTTQFLNDVVQIAKCNISPQVVQPLIEQQSNQIQQKQQQRKNSRSSSPIDYLGLKPKLNVYAPTRTSQNHKQNLSRNFNEIPSPRILNSNTMNEDALATPSQYSLTITPTVQNDEKSRQNVPFVNEFNTQSMFDLEDNQFCSRGSSFNNQASNMSRSFDGTSYQQKSKKQVKFIVDSQQTLGATQCKDNSLNPEASKKPPEEEEIEKLYESLATDMKSLKSCNTSNGNVSSGSQSNIGTLKEKLESIRRNKLLLEDKIKEYEKKLAK